MEIFCKFINVITFTFDHFNAPLMNKCININQSICLTPKQWTVLYEMEYLNFHVSKHFLKIYSCLFFIQIYLRCSGHLFLRVCIKLECKEMKDIWAIRISIKRMLAFFQYSDLSVIMSSMWSSGELKRDPSMAFPYCVITGVTVSSLPQQTSLEERAQTFRQRNAGVTSRFTTQLSVCMYAEKPCSK